MMDNSTKRNIVLAVVVVLIVGAILYLNGGNKYEKDVEVAALGTSNDIPVPSSVLGTSTTTGASSATVASTTESSAARIAAEAAQYSRAKEFISPSGFINTGGPNNDAPITLSQYIGKDVVLLDIWTYSCINCQRTIPYLNALYEKYKGDGFVIIGLSVPEFDFEKNYDNVAMAVMKLGIQYPVVLDNDGLTAAEYGMQYWPEDWLINIDGFIIDHHIGEGDYAQEDAMVAAALAQRSQVLGVTGVINTSVAAPTASDPDVTVENESPETYFGAYRNDLFANGVPGEMGVQNFNGPSATSTELLPDQFYLGGSWNIENQYAQTAAAGATITYEYTSPNVFFVAGSGLANAAPVQAELLLDGKPLGANAGADVTNVTAADGTVHSYVEIGENRLYRLVSDTVSGTHVLQIIAQGAGLQAYTFTFGADEN